MELDDTEDCTLLPSFTQLIRITQRPVGEKQNIDSINHHWDSLMFHKQNLTNYSDGEKVNLKKSHKKLKIKSEK